MKLHRRQWARENWTIGNPVDPTWHPVVIDEIAKMDGEPDEDAITTTDGRTFWQYRKLVLTVDEDEDRDEALVTHMNSVQSWPDCWSISDHGNAHRIDLTEAYKTVAE